jgi:hypothetical protein
MNARNVCALLSVALLTSPPALLKTSTQSDNIKATAEARALLNRMAENRGGRAALSSVRAVLIETTRTLDSGTASRATYRILLPDRFKETGLATYTINRTGYWQRPQPPPRLQQIARENKLKRFVEWSLLMLLRAPDVLPVAASVESTKWDGSNVRGLRFTDGDRFDYTFVVAADGTLLGFFHDDTLSIGNKVQMVRRTAVVREMTRQGGLSFPKQLSETIGPYGSKVVIERLDLAPPLTEADFREPR